MINFISLCFTSILIAVLCIFIQRTKHHDQLKNAFLYTLLCLLICCAGLIFQILFSDTFNIPPIYFDYFVYIGTCFSPITFLFVGLIFAKKNIKFKKNFLLLFIVPILSLIILWTNDFHHLFFAKYSINMGEGIVGKYFIIHSLYTYLLLCIGLYYLIRASIKSSGLFSKQAILIIVGASVPVFTNILGSFGLISMTIYVTPITFAFTIFCITLAIFKFGFLKITPVTLKNIVNRISDSYIVLNDSYAVVDFNSPLFKIFNKSDKDILNKNLFELDDNFKDFKTYSKDLTKAINSARNCDDTFVIDKYFRHVGKYFHIEINRITERGVFIGTLLLLKDVTQHKLDLKTIENNQEILVEKERLASLGQMIGGIAHNLKTPIMSISGATEGILELVNEYKNSIGDSEVTVEDHLEIAGEMEDWLQKIHTHLAYMSDVITTVKGQAVAFSDNSTFTSFTVDDFVKQVNILMKHELSHSLVELEEILQVPKDTVVNGNINSLVQVVNNIISNAIQAYNGAPGQKVIMDIYFENKRIIFKIQDFAGGLPETVKKKLFKEMVTTKGKNGTGLGLFMSYSNIKAHFNGNIRFETKKGKGTTFFIEIPC